MHKEVSHIIRIYVRLTAVVFRWCVRSLSGVRAGRAALWRINTGYVHKNPLKRLVNIHEMSTAIDGAPSGGGEKKVSARKPAEARKGTPFENAEVIMV